MPPRKLIKGQLMRESAAGQNLPEPRSPLFRSDEGNDCLARFLRFIPRNEMDIAVANAAAFVELDESQQNFVSARISIGSVAPTPLYVKEAGSVLTGNAINDASILEAATLARNAASPIEDMRGTVEHRLQLVETLTKRVLTGAVARARGEIL